MTWFQNLKSEGSDIVRRVIEPAGYGVGLSLYRLGVMLASPFNTKARLLDRGQREVWRLLRKKCGKAGGYVWVHCASLGEFEQGRPLIERIRAERPETKVILTFFSPSGYEIRKNYAGADIVCYLPMDVPGAASRFLDIVRPRLAVFVKYELWRGYLQQLHKRGIPTLLISANFRADQPFFRRRGSWYAGWLRWLTHIYVQTPESVRLLAGIGIDDATVAGDTRFDRVAGIREAAKEIGVLERFAGRRGSEGHKEPVFIAGSSWPADEAVYASWLEKRGNSVKGIIAPHEFDAARLGRLKSLFKGKAVLKSEAEENPDLLDDARVLIIDCFGILSSAYAYADIAYVGGGFGVGIHNINEAAAFGIPVIYGPNHHKFVEAEELSTLGGGLPVESREGFELVADRILFNSGERERRGRWSDEYIAEKTGATDVIWKDIIKMGYL